MADQSRLSHKVSLLLIVRAVHMHTFTCREQETKRLVIEGVGQRTVRLLLPLAVKEKFLLFPALYHTLTWLPTFLSLLCVPVAEVEL